MDTLTTGEPLAPSAADLQPGLAIDRVNPFVIRDDAFAADQRVQASIPKAWPLSGVRLEPCQ